MRFHSIWFGGKEPSMLVNRCIDTWPDDCTIWSRAMLSSVVPWLYDIEYFNVAYRANHWAGASDVARLALLYEFGGVYLDTDVEIVRQDGIDRLLKQQNDVVLGWEDDETNVCGAVIIAPQPKMKFIGKMLDVYRRTRFQDTFNGQVNGTTLLSDMARTMRDGLMLMPRRVFYPWHWTERDISDANKQIRIGQPEVICAHHWEGSWVKEWQK